VIGTSLEIVCGCLVLTYPLAGKALLDSEEGKECLRAYTAIMASLQAYENQHREEWALEIENTSAEKLKQPLLGRNPENSFIFVNFE
jgi:hypothetical protein